MPGSTAPKGKSRRITSNELVEVRTVLSRAKTALATIDSVHRNDCAYHRYFGVIHTEHELSMMRSALMTSIDVLGKVEAEYGYRSAE